MSHWGTVTRFVCDTCDGPLIRIHPGNEVTPARYRHDRQASNHHKPRPREVKIKRYC